MVGAVTISLAVAVHFVFAQNGGADIPSINNEVMQAVLAKQIAEPSTVPATIQHFSYFNVALASNILLKDKTDGNSFDSSISYFLSSV